MTHTTYILRHSRGKDKDILNRSCVKDAIYPCLQPRVPIVRKSKGFPAKQSRKASHPSHPWIEIDETGFPAKASYFLDIFPVLLIIDKSAEMVAMTLC